MAPDKTKLFPNENIRTVCYIQNLPPRPNVDIGDYTYYSDNSNPPSNFMTAFSIIMISWVIVW